MVTMATVHKHCKLCLGMHVVQLLNYKWNWNKQQLLLGWLSTQCITEDTAEKSDEHVG